MDQEFADIFTQMSADISNRYVYDLRYGRIFSEASDMFGLISTAISRAEESILFPRGEKLRSDARYFLLVNLMEMFAIPLSLRTGPQVPLLPSQMDSDLAVLLASASDLQQARYAPSMPPDGQSGISGHSMIEAIASNWANLGLNQLRVWG